MTPRERILSVIKHELPDQIPAHALNIDDARPYLNYLGLKDKDELADYFGMCIKRVWPDYMEPTEGSDAMPLFDDGKPLSPFGTPEQVRAEVKERIRILGKNGGYICGPDHHIKPTFPIENTFTMYDEIKKYRGEGYTL